MLNLYGISNILAAITSSAIALLVYVKGHKSRTNRIWSVFASCVAIYGFGAYMASITADKDSAFFWWQISYVGVIMLPVLFLHFVYSFLNIKQRVFIKFIYFLTFIILATNVLSRELFVGNVSLLFTNSRWFKPAYWIYPPGPLHIFHTLFFYFGIVAWAHIVLIKEYKRAGSLKQYQIRYFFFATALGFIGGGTSYLPCFGIKIYPLLNFTVPLYPLIMTYAIVRYRLMDIKVAVTRAGIFLIVYTLVLGFPFWLGYNTKSWFVSTFFMFFLASTGPLIYRFLQRKAENLLLAQQRRYQKILLQAAGGMVREHNLGKLLKLIVYVVKRIVRIEFAAILLEDRENKCYRLKAVRDHYNFPVDFLLSGKHPLITLIKRKREILTHEEVNSFFKESAKRDVHLVVPSFIDSRLSGILVLGEKENKTLYTEDDINVFRILSHQAALAIENCLFFEEFKKAQEKIFIAEKLASIGGMADGVAHQIKNRLNHFSIATGEMQYEIRDFVRDHTKVMKKQPALKKTFDYLSQIAESLITNVKRTDGIIKGILNYARTSEKDTFFGEFSFNEIIDLSLDLLKVKHEIADFPLKVKLDKPDTIYGVKAQMLEVIYNILDNGYEALKEKGMHLDLHKKDRKDFNPMITLRLTQKERFSFIEISDNGIGIKEEDRQKIFAPFFTTKSSYKSGTGIGMYVVKRLIEENHHGKVWFSSVYLEGTQLFIKLPRK